MKLVNRFLEALFPDSCVGCGARGSLLCAQCQKKVPPASAPEHDFITSIFAYQDFRIKKLVWMLKFKNGRRVAAHFGPYLAAALEEHLGEEKLFIGAGRILIVPIPLSRGRHKKRGYNQAEELARAMLKNLPEGKYHLETKLLKKEIETTPQADIRKRSARLSNLGDCFLVLPNTFGRGQTVILIDDVTTTGATLKAARKALRAAGFKKVFALTVAH